MTAGCEELGPPRRCGCSCAKANVQHVTRRVTPWMRREARTARRRQEQRHVCPPPSPCPRGWTGKFRAHAPRSWAAPERGFYPVPLLRAGSPAPWPSPLRAHGEGDAVDSEKSLLEARATERACCGGRGDPGARRRRGPAAYGGGGNRLDFFCPRLPRAPESQWSPA